ncbi:DUF4168 domain-containing protein [Maritimibacter sp. HL-12]|jgi:hypothetical protein|uniref:DUF4168 domain-containing protein n=1 Tax=Maritimibacter sp. HL-12 TaxID=1162418 RepID=UPI000A0F1AD7|nr:DUF4168 domain-containing protein [Maritimibacter sp. HL-12]SMH51902.1 protein of unknown function [Maritimibacter sp. HL-12]
MQFAKKISAMTLAGLIGLATPVAVMAQDQQTAPTAADVTGDEIDAFVVAYERVTEIEQEFAAQIAEAADQREQDELRQQALTEQTEAVDETPGIDVDRYVEIITIAQADPDLNDMILEKINQ